MLTTVLLMLTCIGVFYLAFVHNIVIKAVVYLAAMWVCTLFTDILTIGKVIVPLPVRKPFKESLIAVSFILLGIIGMMLRFVWLDWKQVQGFGRLGVAALMILFAFPIAISIVLLLSKYKLKDLGLRLSPLLFTGVVALAITAVTGLIFAPADLTFTLVLKETGGIGGMLLTGFVIAALPEELSRMICQTRLGVLFSNKALGWYLACFFWAFMHFPKWYGEGDIFEGVMGAIRIIPLGLMWSYLIHRTQSIFPSIIAHGLNIWGLQNF